MKDSVSDAYQIYCGEGEVNTPVYNWKLYRSRIGFRMKVFFIVDK